MAEEVVAAVVHTGVHPSPLAPLAVVVETNVNDTDLVAYR